MVVGLEAVTAIENCKVTVVAVVALTATWSTATDGSEGNGGVFGLMMLTSPMVAVKGSPPPPPKRRNTTLTSLPSWPAWMLAKSCAKILVGEFGSAMAIVREGVRTIPVEAACSSFPIGMILVLEKPA